MIEDGYSACAPAARSVQRQPVRGLILRRAPTILTVGEDPQMSYAIVLRRFHRIKVFRAARNRRHAFRRRRLTARKLNFQA
jgi:hypothetical protein